MLSRAQLPKTHKAAIAFYIDFLTAAAELGTVEYVKAKRWLIRNDLFYLLVFVCHRPDMNHPWIFARCREVELAPNGH